MAPSKRVRVGYTVQIAVDTKHNLIAEQQVHSKVTDLGLLAETATAARENLGVDTIDPVADRGYFRIEDIEDCEANGVTPFLPKPDRSLARRSVLLAGVSSRAAEASWPSTGMAHGRSATSTGRRAGPVSRETSAPAQRSERSSAMRAKRRWIGWPNVSQPFPRSWARRRESVEHPFGTIKQRMGQGTFLTRRLGNVRGEFSLTALAYNLRRAISLVGVNALVAAASA